MIRFLSQMQHCRKTRSCPSKIITVDMFGNIHMFHISGHWRTLNIRKIRSAAQGLYPKQSVAAVMATASGVSA
jgi:hypothetical protein